MHEGLIERSRQINRGKKFCEKKSVDEDVAEALENIRLHNEQDEDVPSSEDDDVPDPEDVEEVIILEEVKSGESGAVVASPNENFGQNQAPKNNKRKRKEILC